MSSKASRASPRERQPLKGLVEKSGARRGHGLQPKTRSESRSRGLRGKTSIVSPICRERIAANLSYHRTKEFHPGQARTTTLGPLGPVQARVSHRIEHRSEPNHRQLKGGSHLLRALACGPEPPKMNRATGLRTKEAQGSIQRGLAANAAQNYPPENRPSCPT